MIDLDPDHTGEPNSRRHFSGQGVVQYGDNSRPCKVWTRYGHERPNPWLNSPLPNATYYVGASRAQRQKQLRLSHIFATTFDGTTSFAEAIGVQLFKGRDKGARWPKEWCMPIGFPGGNYDRGHLIAAEFGAGMETINLVSMPSVVNRSRRPETARKQGFDQIADLGDRYNNDEHHWKGSFTTHGEYILPNYRRFEEVVRREVTNGLKLALEVSLRITPATAAGITDVLHAELWLGNEAVRYVLDNDLQHDIRVKSENQ